MKSIRNNSCRSLTYERLIVNYIGTKINPRPHTIEAQRNRLRIVLGFKKKDNYFLSGGSYNTVPYSNFGVEQHFYFSVCHCIGYRSPYFNIFFVESDYSYIYAS